jgi:hypothetical protein
MPSQIQRLLAEVARLFVLSSAVLKPRFLLPVLAIVYLTNSFFLLNRTIHDEKLLTALTAKDSQHYIKIAENFGKGDFSMSYVKRWPHRQPLYPLLLAPFANGSESAFWMGTVNIWIGLATIMVLYFCILRLFSNPLIAAFISLLYITNRMVIEEVSGRIMTEPLHLLLVIVAIFYFVNHLTTSKRSFLFIAAAAVGLDYLTRPNGLIVMAAMMMVFFLHEVFSFQRRADWLREVGQSVVTFAIAVAIFLVLAMPSWVPRLSYLHDPFSHGYLANYMWVDTYAQGHTGAAHVSFTWRDYAANHDFGDFITRWIHGLVETASLPPRREARFPVLYYLAIGGFILAGLQRNRTYLALAVFFVMQMLPLVWTTLSNPTDRVPYAAMLPFEFFFAAYALEFLWQRLTTGLSRGSFRQSGPSIGPMGV